MHYLYIAFSKASDKFYIGETHNVEERIFKHNNHTYQDSYTKIANDWSAVMIFKCVNREDATFLEAFIKRMKSRKFIAKVITNLKS